ncbi:MAG: M20 family metallo-hydrolase [Candidatus Methanomethylicia archaeon]
MDVDWLRNQFEIFKGFSDTGIGITRVTYTESWLKAHDYVKKLMMNEGLEVRVDGVGNIIGSFKPMGEIEGRIAMGSHIDSVSNGGNYDGLVGVLSAIEIVRIIKRLNFNKQIDVIVFAAEEGERFNVGCLGSKAISGELSDDDLNSIVDRNGKSLLQVLKDCGFSGDLSSCRISRGFYDKFFEVHIEQGPVLESMNMDIGVVTGISAPSRIMVQFTGLSGHSGTVPMDYRRDASLPLAEIIFEVRRMVEEFKSVAVGTVGYVQIKPNVATVIPGEAKAIIEFRSISREVKDLLIRSALDSISKLGLKYNVECEAKVIVDEDPVVIPNYIVELIENSTLKLGYKALRMPSGASHDSAHMSRICDVGMIFIPCKGGYSHMPLEETSLDNIVKGSLTLLETVVSI